MALACRPAYFKWAAVERHGINKRVLFAARQPSVHDNSRGALQSLHWLSAGRFAVWSRSNRCAFGQTLLQLLLLCAVKHKVFCLHNSGKKSINKRTSFKSALDRFEDNCISTWTHSWHVFLSPGLMPAQFFGQRRARLQSLAALRQELKAPETALQPLVAANSGLGHLGGCPKLALLVESTGFFLTKDKRV